MMVHNKGTPKYYPPPKPIDPNDPDRPKSMEAVVESLGAGSPNSRRVPGENFFCKTCNYEFVDSSRILDCIAARRECPNCKKMRYRRDANPPAPKSAIVNPKSGTQYLKRAVLAQNMEEGGSNERFIKRHTIRKGGGAHVIA